MEFEHIKSCPRCPELNGRSERLNRSLMEMARCMMIASGAPKTFWAEAVNTACYLKNSCPSRALNYEIPIALWENRALTFDDLNKIKTFGCRVWTHIDNTRKLDAKAEEYAFLGYEVGTSGGLRVFSLHKGKILIRNHGIFEETVFPFQAMPQKLMSNVLSPAPSHLSPSCIPLTISSHITNECDEVQLPDQTPDSPAAPDVIVSPENTCQNPPDELQVAPMNVMDVINQISDDDRALTLNDVLSLDYGRERNCTLEELPILPVGICNLSSTIASDIKEPKNV